MAKAPIELAHAPLADVRAYLKKLKSKEAELELALTLRVDPSVEEHLVRISTCVVDLRNTEKLLKLEAKPLDDDEIAKQWEDIGKRKDMCCQRLAGLGVGPHADKLREFYQQAFDKAVAEEEVVGMSKTLLKFKAHFERVQVQLCEAYEKWCQAGIPAHFDPFEEIPDLVRYLEKPSASTDPAHPGDGV